MAKKQLNVLVDDETRAEIGVIRRRFKLNSDGQAVAYAVHALATSIGLADYGADLLVDRPITPDVPIKKLDKGTLRVTDSGTTSPVMVIRESDAICEVTGKPHAGNARLCYRCAPAKDLEQVADPQ